MSFQCRASHLSMNILLKEAIPSFLDDHVQNWTLNLMLAIGDLTFALRQHRNFANKSCRAHYLQHSSTGNSYKVNSIGRPQECIQALAAVHNELWLLKTKNLYLFCTNISCSQFLQNIESSSGSTSVFVAQMSQVTFEILRKMAIFCLERETSI
jgi:hypothetical protein